MTRVQPMTVLSVAANDITICITTNANQNNNGYIKLSTR